MSVIYKMNKPKSTLSAMRLKSVGKNLFDKGNIQKYTAEKIQVIDGKNVVELNGQYNKKISIRGVFKQNTQYTITAIGKRPDNSTIAAGGWLIKYTDGISFGGSRSWGATWKADTITSKIGKTIQSIETTNAGNGAHRTHIIDLSSIQLEEGTTATPYEPYKESVAYITAKDESGNILELRSLPNGTKDEIRVSENKLIKRIGDKTNVASGTVIDYSDMADNGTYYAWNDDGETETGVKGDTLGIDATELIYQLAMPVETPVQVSGTLVSYPSGTVYIEPYVADAGIYTDKMTVLHQDLPIKVLEKLSKIDFTTGLETELDVSDAVIAENKLSFTHPDLVDGDIVFFTYEYDRESTEGETEIEYYDSRYVIKGEDDKFYQWEIEAKLVEGVITPSIKLVEV